MQADTPLRSPISSPVTLPKRTNNHENDESDSKTSKNSTPLSSSIGFQLRPLPQADTLGECFVQLGSMLHMYSQYTNNQVCNVANDGNVSNKYSCAVN